MKSAVSGPHSMMTFVIVEFGANVVRWLTVSLPKNVNFVEQRAKLKSIISANFQTWGKRENQNVQNGLKRWLHVAAKRWWCALNVIIKFTMGAMTGFALLR